MYVRAVLRQPFFKDYNEVVLIDAAFYKNSL